VGLVSGTVKPWLRPRLCDEPYPTGYVTACAVLYRSSILRHVGLFDEDYFMYYEDSDLGYRLRAAGYKSVIHPRAGALHHVPRDLGRRQLQPHFLYYLHRNRLLFARKRSGSDAAISAIIFRSILELLIAVAKGNPGGAWAGWQGCWDALRGVVGRWRRSPA